MKVRMRWDAIQVVRPRAREHVEADVWDARAHVPVVVNITAEMLVKYLVLIIVGRAVLVGGKL